MACDVSITDNPTPWHFDYEGCNNTQTGFMDINDLNESIVVEGGEFAGQKKLKFAYTGENTNNHPMETTIWIPELEAKDSSDNINPTKVFWYIVKKTKEYVCPQCL